ncbi:unnamed protein product, partial [Didymodactylos carnosus]
MSQKPIVHVEYDGAGYEPRYQVLREQILRKVPESTVTGAQGRSSSFEVTLNNKEIFSKLKVGQFPNSDK